MSQVTIVVPCYNEAERFRGEALRPLLVEEGVSVLLVDDGSTDQTPSLLADAADHFPGRVQVISLPENLGKAEAVRRGLQQAIAGGAEIVGYMDGDFATPSEELRRLLTILEARPDVDVLLGSRWLHLGADIQRSQWRHYAGRVFATIASLVLNLKVYDTQCGAKLFRAGEALADSIDPQFQSRWGFDVELIGRLRQVLDEDRFLEVPLNTWKDVKGSKITFFEMISATLALFRLRQSLGRHLRRR